MPTMPTNATFHNIWTAMIADAIANDEGWHEFALDAAKQGPENLAYEVENNIVAAGLALELVTEALDRVAWQELVDYLNAWSE